MWKMVVTVGEVASCGAGHVCSTNMSESEGIQKSFDIAAVKQTSKCWIQHHVCNVTYQHRNL